jgi:hypothetical protein
MRKGKRRKDREREKKKRRNSCEYLETSLVFRLLSLFIFTRHPRECKRLNMTIIVNSAYKRDTALRVLANVGRAHCFGS